jgi:hypothetical protein
VQLRCGLKERDLGFVVDIEHASAVAGRMGDTARAR